MRCKVKLFSTNPTELAADGSHVPASTFLEYRNSDNYKKMIAGKNGTVSLTHFGRNLQNATHSGPAVAKTVGKNDMSLLMAEHGAEPIFYITSLDLENDGWVYAWIQSFPPELMDDNALQTYKRASYLILSGCLLKTSAVILSYWSDENSKSVAKKIINLTLDFTNNPSWSQSGVVESYDDDGNLISSMAEELATKKFSDIQLDDVKYSEIKVKMFSNVSEIPEAIGLPKSSKIDGSFTKLFAKSFSYTGKCGGVCEILDDEQKEFSESEPEEKVFTVATVKERLREAKMNPRMELRRLVISYKQMVKSLGGHDKIDEVTMKQLKSLFASDALRIIGSQSNDILKGKQLNTLLGLSSLGKVYREAGQKLQLPLRQAYIEFQKQGFLTKMRTQRLQSAYNDLIQAMMGDIFGPNPEPIPEETEEEEQQ